MPVEPAPEQRRTWFRSGLALIAYGIVGGLYQYWHDSTSMDFFAMDYAVKGGVTHAVLFGLAGLAFIGWSRRRDTDDD